MTASLKPYPAYKPSGVEWLGDVPAHWEVLRVRNAVDMRVSNVDKHTKKGELPIRLCNYVDVYKNDKITKQISFMRATASAEEIERFRLEKGDILLTKDSEAWNDIGVPALVEDDAKDLVSGYHLALLRPRKDMLSGAYLLRAFQCSTIAHQFHVSANGVTRYGLSYGAIKSVILPIPPLPEQHRIATFLDQKTAEIDEAITKKQCLIDLLKEQKAILINLAVTKGLNPNVPMRDSGVEWIGEVPAHWGVKRLKHLFTEVDERSIDGKETLLSLRMYGGLVPHAEVSDKIISTADLIGYKCVYPGQLVMNRMRASIGLFGVARHEGLVSPDYATFDTSTAIDEDYYLHLFKASTLRRVFRLESKGLGTGASGFLRLYSDRFGRIQVPVPPKSDQEKIVLHIEAITKESEYVVEKMGKEITRLNELKNVVISNAVTGKIKV